MADFDKMLKDLGVDMVLHSDLEENQNRLHAKYFQLRNNRPVTMNRFDDSRHASHAGRVDEIHEHRKAGVKSIGTFCIYVPDEIALAAEVLPIPLCGGSGWSVSYADKVLPRDICPIVRSTFGMAVSNTCPYKKLKDFAVGETTCDAKKKAWDLFGFKVLEVPQKKNEEDINLWRREVHAFREMMEKLSGQAITGRKLLFSILLMNRKRDIMRQINEFRKLDEPPINGLDALLISQVALNQDTESFISDCIDLKDELSERVKNGVSAYDKSGRRVLIAGAPSPMGYAKVHHIAESAGMRIVADESCTGMRYFRDDVEEITDDLDAMIDAVAARYFKIDCSCFSPNTERFENISKIIKDYRIDGVIQHVLQYCHGYNVEARKLEKMLKEMNIPSITIETDYSEEDSGQIRTRLEAFAEMMD